MAVSDPDRSDRVVPIAPPPLVTLTAEARRGLLAPRRQPRPVYPPMSFSKWWRSLGWRHLVLVVAVLFTLYPLAWMASASINPVDTLSGASLIPEGASFDNYSADPRQPARVAVHDLARQLVEDRPDRVARQRAARGDGGLRLQPLPLHRAPGGTPGDAPCAGVPPVSRLRGDLPDARPDRRRVPRLRARYPHGADPRVPRRRHRVQHLPDQGFHGLGSALARRVGRGSTEPPRPRSSGGSSSPSSALPSP